MYQMRGASGRPPSYRGFFLEPRWPTGCGIGEKMKGMNPSQQMMAAVLYGKEDLRLERIPIPVPAAGEIVIQVAAALTCGTDLKVYRRGYHAMMLQPPIPFGHELAGTVSAVGEGVTRFALG